MERVIKWFATCLLTGAFLLLAFGAIAILDEGVRLPFYLTLPLCALLFNGIALFLLFRSKSGTKGFDQIRVRFPSVPFRPSIFNLSGYGMKRSHGVLGHASTEKSRVRVPSLQEIEAALGKVHSVAWGFPVANGSARSVGQEEHISYEARQ